MNRRSRALTLVEALVVAATAITATLVPSPSAAEDCGDLPVSVSCGVGADPPDGYFHGVIGVTGQGWVLGLSSHAGNSPGCGDCVWTISLDCPGSSPSDPGDTTGCAGMQAGLECPPGTLPYRLYLTTSSVNEEVVGIVCLGGTYRIVLVSEDAQADVDRHLHDVAPPDLAIHRRPRGATLTGLPTYFTAEVPAGGVGPFAFGDPTISESITLVPQEIDWIWGDGTSSGWLAVPAWAMHRYLTDGVFPGILITRWAATYTATFEGQTVGPYAATGTLDHRQPFLELVDTSNPTLVSR